MRGSKEVNLKEVLRLNMFKFNRLSNFTPNTINFISDGFSNFFEVINFIIKISDNDEHLLDLIRLEKSKIHFHNDFNNAIFGFVTQVLYHKNLVILVAIGYKLINITIELQLIMRI